MRERCGCGENVRTLPLALRRKPSVKPGSRDGRTILFAGSMWWLPNRHGLAWFFENCWGPVLAARPGTRLVLAGNDKTGFAREMAGRYPNVTATGFVEDIDPFFREASVFVLPLLIGTGIKIKLLEALAWGLPVVSTPKGIEGVTGLEEGRHALARENPADFAKGLVSLLENPALCETMGREGLAFTGSNSMALESVIDEVFCDE
jgi:glycosyltransferase involved in cell wall biosynthesis